MPDSCISSIEDTITAIHGNDAKQLEVIFSKEDRLIVEAPAGYGKTATMVSRIAYLYATGQIPNPKKILGLTFSVNAALKIKRDIAVKLPTLLIQQNNLLSLADKLTVTNYHGLCKMVLKKYGGLLSDLLKKDVNSYYAIGDTDISKYSEITNSMSAEEREYLLEINNRIITAVMPASNDIDRYNSIVLQRLLPLGYITHNAILLLTITLFNQKQEIKDFYSNFYTLIIVDEFQDTNCVAWSLLKILIGTKTKLLFLGDSLQRIYGFIGAIPSLMDEAAAQYTMKKIVLTENYRFRDNIQMLRLDNNIRQNAIAEFALSDCSMAEIPAFWGRSQEEESSLTVIKISELLAQSPDYKIALLLRSRSDSVGVIENALDNAGIDYFYGMFTDEDLEYIRFHDYCQRELIRVFGGKKHITSFSLQKFASAIEKNYEAKDVKVAHSLTKLLSALIIRLAKDYGELQAEEKYELLLDIFENRQLKQAMEYVDSAVVLSTVHGAKGLEWDYVFISDMENWGMPGYFTCKDCPNKFDKRDSDKCLFPDVSDEQFKKCMLDELSVFYVAVTRAKKQVFFSSSQSAANGKGRKLSCFISMPGIKLINAAAV